VNTVLYEIHPSPNDKNAHKGLGTLSALFAVILGIFIIWSALDGKLSTWTIIILCLPVILFSAIAWFVLRFRKIQFSGIRVYPDGIDVYFPMLETGKQPLERIRFDEIRLLDFEENVELHRMGRRVKRFNVYRIQVMKIGKENLEPFQELVDLKPDQILKFRQLPHFLVSNELLEPEKIDTKKMPKV
jgi:hypothetical protein